LEQTFKKSAKNNRGQNITATYFSVQEKKRKKDLGRVLEKERALGGGAEIKSRLNKKRNWKISFKWGGL